MTLGAHHLSIIQSHGEHKKEIPSGSVTLRDSQFSWTAKLTRGGNGIHMHACTRNGNADNNIYLTKYHGLMPGKDGIDDFNLDIRVSPCLEGSFAASSRSILKPKYYTARTC